MGGKYDPRRSACGTKGMIAFDQERMNELQVYAADEAPAAERGFRDLSCRAAGYPPDAARRHAGTWVTRSM